MVITSAIWEIKLRILLILVMRMNVRNEGDNLAEKKCYAQCSWEMLCAMLLRNVMRMNVSQESDNIAEKCYAN